MTDFAYEKRGEKQDVLVVCLEGWLDVERCDYLFGCIEYLLDEGYRKLVLDCNELDTVSSVGLGMLVRIQARMKRCDGALVLASIGAGAEKVIRLVNLDRVLKISQTVDEAVELLDE